MNWHEDEKYTENLQESTPPFQKTMGNSIKKRASRLLFQAIRAVGKALLPYLLGFLALFLIVVLAWYFLLEIRGAEGHYSLEKQHENQLKLNENGYFSAYDLSDENKAIQEFYKYFSLQKSFYQILTNDHSKLEQKGFLDYYQKERMFLLSDNLLFMLDELVYRGVYRYPEQFVQPVHYDPKALRLLPLTDDKGRVTALSKKRTKDGTPIQNKDGSWAKEKGVQDYGLASVFKYQKAQKTVTVEGTVYAKDVWDDGCKCIKQVSVNEPFSYVMDGYPQDIWLMTKAITFTGDYQFFYKKEKKPMYDLMDGTGEANSDRTRVAYGTYDEYRDEPVYGYIEKEVTDPKTGEKKKIKEYGVVGYKKVFVKRHTLYQYRKGKVYETVPVEEVEKRKIPDPVQRERYLRDYLYNFQAWIPYSAMTKFDFEKRVGEIIHSEIEVGSAADDKKLKKTMQYLPIIEKYAKTYGVDPYLILAKMTQESGGDPNVEDGLMQITGDGARTVKAKNLQTGQYDTFTVYNEADRRNPEKAIRWGVMYFANKMERFDGDPLKALQSYNFDVMIIKELHPEAWNSMAWMNYREEARLYHGRKELGVETRSVSYSCAPELKKDESLKVYGDVCYIEHVLRYYIGDQFQSLAQHDKKNPGQEGREGWLGQTIDKVVSFLKVKTKSYNHQEKKTEFTHLMHKKEVDTLLRSVKTFDHQILFSQADYTEELAFWEEGFTQGAVPSFRTEDEFWEVVGQHQYIPPVKMKNPPISSKFGMRWGRLHAGVDVAVPVGTPIYAVADGQVVKAVGDQGHSKESWGNYIKIRHEGDNYSLYGHLSEVLVKEGEQVKQGQLIGYSGNSGRSTGPHLHFEFYLGGPETSRRVDPYFIVVQPHLFP
ncbi:UNVERIFIED_ORG: transglycosylase-like protein with SLT domain [Anoxybacillus amylolyticus]